MSPRRRVPAVQRSGLAGPLTLDERLNDLYPSQCLDRYGCEEAAARRYELVGRALPESHPLHWLCGDPDARRRFARSCPDRRLGYILTGSREPVDPAVLAEARA